MVSTCIIVNYKKHIIITLIALLLVLLLLNFTQSIGVISYLDNHSSSETYFLKNTNHTTHILSSSRPHENNKDYLKVKSLVILWFMLLLFCLSIKRINAHVDNSFFVLIIIKLWLLLLPKQNASSYKDSDSTKITNYLNVDEEGIMCLPIKL